MFDNLYRIIENNGNRFVVNLDKDNIIFKVHFEGSPVLPGACMVEISRELVEISLGKKLKIERIKSIKFVKAITPTENEIIIFNIETKDVEDGKTAASIQVEGTAEDEVFAKIDLIFNII